MNCPLCQYRFDDRNACHGCGITKACTMVKCPNCGYEFVEKSQTIAFFSKIINRLRRKKGEKHL